MTADDDKFIYTASIPESAEGIIFTDGASSNSKQTVDIESGIKDGAHWAVLNEKDTAETTKYKVHAVPTYYLVGTMTSWGTTGASVFVPIKNDSKKEEYKLSAKDLSATDSIKVYSSDDTWYPNGMNNEFEISSNGTYDIYFRPNGDGNADWHESYFYAVNVTQYTITWKDGDGNTLKTDTVTHGQTPSYKGSTPTKTATAQYTYTFNNTWTPTVKAAAADAVYTAQFDSTVNKYTVTWLDGNGDVLKTEQVDYGETPIYDGDTPTESATDQYTYTFNGTWSPEITAVNDDVTYTANFDSTEIIPEKIGYAISLKNEIGINFYLYVPEHIDRDSAVVTFTWGTGNYQKTAVTKLVAPTTKSTSANCMATCYVAARSMTDIVTMTVTDNEGNVIITDSYRVVDYANQAATQYADRKDLLKLLCDMLDYGNAAQIQFDYKSAGDDADLAGDYISVVDESWQRTTDSAAPADESDINDLDSSKFGIKYYGASLSADSAVTIRLYFRITDEDVFAATTASLGDTDLEFMDSSAAGYKYIEIKGIVAKKIFDVNNITFSNGTEKVSELKYSAANYYNTVVAGEYSDSFKGVMKAMYNYSLSAKKIL